MWCTQAQAGQYLHLNRRRACGGGIGMHSGLKILSIATMAYTAIITPLWVRYLLLYQAQANLSLVFLFMAIYLAVILLPLFYMLFDWKFPTKALTIPFAITSGLLFIFGDGVLPYTVTWFVSLVFLVLDHEKYSENRKDGLKTPGHAFDQ